MRAGLDADPPFSCRASRPLGPSWPRQRTRPKPRRGLLPCRLPWPRPACLGGRLGRGLGRLRRNHHLPRKARKRAQGYLHLRRVQAGRVRVQQRAASWGRGPCTCVRSREPPIPRPPRQGSPSTSHTTTHTRAGPTCRAQAPNPRPQAPGPRPWAPACTACTHTLACTPRAGLAAQHARHVLLLRSNASHRVHAHVHAPFPARAGGGEVAAREVVQVLGDLLRGQGAGPGPKQGWSRLLGLFRFFRFFRVRII
jgi:hypothetical protein